MMEFTISRVVLCTCGVALLCASLAVVGGAGDRTVSEMDDGSADRIARILDAFESSATQELAVEGSDLLPSDGYVLTVKGHLVALTSPNGRISMATTSCDQEFELSWSGSIVLKKSVPEGLGDLPDGVGEDVHLLEGVVDVGGSAGAAVYPP